LSDVAEVPSKLSAEAQSILILRFAMDMMDQEILSDGTEINTQSITDKRTYAVSEIAVLPGIRRKSAHALVKRGSSIISVPEE
jgi:hypothetical protein